MDVNNDLDSNVGMVSVASNRNVMKTSTYTPTSPTGRKFAKKAVKTGFVEVDSPGNVTLNEDISPKLVQLSSESNDIQDAAVNRLSTGHDSLSSKVQKRSYPVKKLYARIHPQKKRRNVKKMERKSDDFMDDVYHCCTFQTIIHICPINGISIKKRHKKTHCHNNNDDCEEAEDLNECISNA